MKYPEKLVIVIKATGQLTYYESLLSISLSDYGYDFKAITPKVLGYLIF